MNNPMTPDDITRLAERAKLLWMATGNDDAYYLFHELQLIAQHGKAGGVAVYEVQKKQGAIVYSGWTETTKDTYESGVFPESMFHKRILYASPPAHSPEAGVTIIGWINEDELPDNYPYDAMFPHSKVDGVRLFPVFAPQPKDAT